MIEELKKYPNKVAFTGSVALKLYGATHRKPNNINIIVHNLNNAKSILSAQGYQLTNSHPKNKHYEFEKKNKKSINVFVGGSKLAPRFNSTVMLNGVRVVKLENLLKQKQETLNNFPQPHRIPIIKGNIEAIKSLINKKIQTYTPPPRSTPPSPIRRPSSANFTTPIKGRRLF
jgi:hypothetical protein